MISIIKAYRHSDAMDKIVDNISKMLDRGEKITVLVPSVFSITSDLLIHDKLGRKSMLDFNVMGLTHYIDSLVNEKEKILKDTLCITLINKLLVENHDKLEYFRYNQRKTKMASQFYEAINVLSASGISADAFQEATLKAQGMVFYKKFKDIALIYTKYQEEMKEKHKDLMMMRYYFLDKLKKNEIDISDMNIIVNDFMDLSQVESEIYAELAKKAKSFTIVFLYNNKSYNKHIYPNVICDDFLKLLDSKGLYYRTSTECNNVDKKIQYILENMFSFEGHKNNFISDLSIQINKYNSINQEVIGLCRNIVEMVNEGYRYADMEIAALDLSRYASSIKKYFKIYQIPFMIEEKQKLSEQPTFSFILDLLNLHNNNFSSNYLNKILNSVYSKDSSDISTYYLNLLENMSIKYDCLNEKYFNYLKVSKLKDVLLFIKELKKKLSPLTLKKGTVSEFREEINKVLNNFKYSEINKDMIEISKDSYLKELYQVSDNIIEQMLSQIDDIYKDQVLTLEQFITILKTVADDHNISNAPISQNRVFVGDVLYSSFAENKIVYILGNDSNAFMQAMPNTDLTFFNNNDLAYLMEKFNVNDLSLEYNRNKIKFKFLQLITKASLYLILSYSKNIDNCQNRESTILQELRAYFGDDIKESEISINTLQEKSTVINGLPKYDLSQYFLNEEGRFKMSPSSFPKEKECLLKRYIFRTLNIEYQLRDAIRQSIGLLIHGMFEHLYTDNIFIDKLKKYINADSNNQTNLKTKKDLMKYANVQISKYIDDVLKEENKKPEDIQIGLDLGIFRETIVEEVEELIEHDKKYKLSNFEIERKFASSIFELDIDGEKVDFALVGKSDRLATSDDTINILDYKTGFSTFDYTEYKNGSVKVGFSDQLILYLFAYYLERYNKKYGKKKFLSESEDETIEAFILESLNSNKALLEYFILVRTKKYIYNSKKTSLKLSIDENWGEDDECNVHDFESLLKTSTKSEKDRLAVILAKFYKKHKDISLQDLCCGNHDCEVCSHLDIKRLK